MPELAVAKLGRYSAIIGGIQIALTKVETELVSCWKPANIGIDLHRCGELYIKLMSRICRLFSKVYLMCTKTPEAQSLFGTIYLTSLATANTCSKVLGFERTKKLADKCFSRILYWFARSDQKGVFETVASDCQVDFSTPKGRFINPGSYWNPAGSAWMLDAKEAIKG